ncbi:hypothetical protein [Geothrix terrae]|uniref:hypothetical protein n=1 Tax=Geothrix terrae TaxID=2922720 RepID=UPI001FAE0416|nr:hypothetical protein [Geothrix terrae]
MRRTLGRTSSARLNTMLHHPAAARLTALRARDGLVHVCGWCRKVRTDEGEWVPAEPALLESAGPALTHGVCPDCAKAIVQKRPAVA